MKKVLAKTSYVLLFITQYMTAYIFMGIFVPEITIQPLKDLFTCNLFTILITNSISLLYGVTIVIVYNRLERKINSSCVEEFFRILILSSVLMIFLQTHRLYKITIFFQTSQTYESWSITVLCAVISIIALSIYFYYNIIAKNTAKEWSTVIEKMQSAANEESNIINSEIDSLKSVGEKIDSYFDLINSVSDIPCDINTYYEEIKHSYNSLMSKVP